MIGGGLVDCHRTGSISSDQFAHNLSLLDGASSLPHVQARDTSDDIAPAGTGHSTLALVDFVLEGLAGSKLNRLCGRHLDVLTGTRVAACPGRSSADTKIAEANQLNGVPI